MSNAHNSYVRVVGTAVETTAAATGIGMSIATWQQYTTLSAGIAGILLSLAMTFNYVYKAIAERKRVKLLEREVDERIKLEALKHAEEKIRLDDYKEFAIHHTDRRNQNLTPEQIFNELVKDPEMFEKLKSRIISGELSSESESD